MFRVKDKCTTVCLCCVGTLVVSFVGWLIWVKTNDPVTTGLAVLMMAGFFYLSPSIRMDDSSAGIRESGVKEQQGRTEGEVDSGDSRQPLIKNRAA
ncbi:MAG: hypothetical protein A3F83_03655 [Candidatus Glassbacteria bacterium RIFCSPLOWO2_12_FULL_58_11]|uniref:Uncharacterized protein n=2 Tax=Candidatus Glassiibacteriota TaxID=1817805 RepID=A0A1F5YSU7_9BACT|nr:MAG: hypothetical protein A2Z86_05490 [Candidatus Glassbacteria bacterium GWA2_58_10]OGG03184.1 MAG: hypothetical protein A3F83_03655 [Candidatus Glassbacteria bacterium RIFCSPLOWO2_12_FULL_58_11]